MGPEGFELFDKAGPVNFKYPSKRFDIKTYFYFSCVHYFTLNTPKLLLF
jgi:hypothetical protein